MKILVVTGWYPSPAHPGAGTFVREFARAAARYHAVTVLHCAGRDAAMPRLWRLEQERDPILTAGLLTYRLWEQRLPLMPATYPSRLYAVWQAFRHLVAQGLRPDVIHGHVFGAALPAVIVGRMYGCPVVVAEHASVFPAHHLTPYDRVIAHLAFDLAARVLPVSHFLQRSIEAYGIHARFDVVPNTVDADFFAPAVDVTFRPDPKRILFVGFLDQSDNKGMPHLLQALAALRAQRDDWRLDVLGDGPGRARSERLATDLGLADRVIFHGMQSRADIVRRLQGCAFLVSASLVETFGVVLVEALAAGRPVVATRSGGPTEIVTQETGILVPPADVPALASAINCMLDRFTAYDPVQLSAYARARYSYEAVAATLDRIYGEVAGHAAARSR